MEKMNENETKDVAVQVRDYQTELEQIMRSNVSPRVLKDRISDYHENDIASSFEVLTRDERERLYRILDAEQLSDIFEYLDNAEIYFEELNARKKVEVLSCMEVDQAAALLKRLAKPERNMLIDLIDNESKRDIAMLESFDEDEIGSRMSMNFIEIKAGISIREAMRELINQAAENDNISTLYVTDDDHTFCGAIDLKDLIIAREGSKLDDIIMESYPYVYAREMIEDCIERMKDYSEDSIPVLDENNKIIGVITAQDIVQVVDDEMGDDYAKLAGLASEEELNEPIRQSVHKRLPWLIIGLFGGMLAAYMISFYEADIALFPATAMFIPVITAMGGNVGIQSSAIVVKGLASNTLTSKNILQSISKEISCAVINACICSSIIFILSLCFNLTSLAMPITVTISLFIVIMFASMFGTAFPLLLNKLKIDPALATGPFITLTNDIIGLNIYLFTGKAILGWLL